MRSLDLTLRPISPIAYDTYKKKITMIKLWNYARNGKLISQHMIMINELMIIIAIIFIMKITIMKKINTWIYIYIYIYNMHIYIGIYIGIYI